MNEITKAQFDRLKAEVKWHEPRFSQMPMEIAEVKQLIHAAEQYPCWLATAKALQQDYNKLDAELRQLREDVFKTKSTTPSP